jgi:tetratricopeptide (TPR) repeat protein
MDQVRAIEQAHGPRWSRKAERLLASSIASSDAALSVTLLMRLAGSYYRGGQIDQALAAYDRASTASRQAEDTGTAFDAALAAATIERERKELRGAIDRYRKLAIDWPKNAKAAEAHLLAVHCAAQLAAGQQRPDLGEYKHLLNEHVAKWPTATTASQAWWWLGRLAEHEKNPRGALTAFQNVKSDQPQYAEAIEAAGRCYAQRLAESRGQVAEHERLAGEAVGYFERVIAAAKSRPKDDAAARAAVLSAARVALADLPQGAARAEGLLSTALRRNADSPPEWKTAARGLLVAALAENGRTDDAEKLLQQLPIDATAEALAVAQLLGDARGRSEKEAARKLARLELTVLDDLLLARDKINSKALPGIARQRAAALAAAGRRAEALASLKELVRENPRDGQAQEDLAGLMADGDRESQKAALEQWRLVASKSRPGSPRWLRAQYGLARTQLELGNPQQASKLIKLVAAAHPDLGGPPLKASFEELLEACDARSPAAGNGRLGAAQ